MRCKIIMLGLMSFILVQAIVTANVYAATGYAACSPIQSSYQSPSASYYSGYRYGVGEQFNRLRPEQPTSMMAKQGVPDYCGQQYMHNMAPNIRQPLIAMEEAAPKLTTTQYHVQAGDTLYRIAKFFDTTVDILMVDNRISDPTTLQIGTKLKIRSEDHEIASILGDGSGVNNILNATLTAYTAGFESTGKTPSHPEYGITASGAKVKKDHTIAVDPKLIPLGSLVYIEGLGIRKAEDTGSAIKGAKIDVYIPDLQEALQFGVKKNVKVYVLNAQI